VADGLLWTRYSPCRFCKRWTVSRVAFQEPPAAWGSVDACSYTHTHTDLIGSNNNYPENKEKVRKEGGIG